MNELTKLNKLFEDNAVLNNEELNALIFSINGIIDYLTDPVNGLEERLNNIRSAISLIPTLTENIIIREEVGLSGISTLLAFTGASNLEEAISKLDFKSESYPPTNYSESSNVQINPGEILFMTTAKGREIGGGSYSWITDSSGNIWSTPVLIGSNTTSTTGVDTNEFNYIYCRTKKSVDASGFYPLSGLLNLELEQLGILEWIESHQNGGSKFSNHLITHYDTVNFENNNPENINLINGLWVDHPYGISTEFPHEWMIGYHMVDGQWKYYFGPVMISNYGHDGLDADGLEYIFKADSSISITLNPPYSGTIGNSNLVLTGVTVDSENYLNDDFIPSGWSDEPVEATENLPYVYVSIRKQHKDLNGNPVWEAFTQPKLWGVFATDGVNGQYTLFIYLNSTSNPDAPTSDFAYPPTDWSITATTPDFANKEYTWCSSRDVTFAANTNLPSYGEWCTPYRITGEDGEPGTDGNFIEFIYTRNNTGIVPPAPPSDGTYLRDWPNVDGNTPSATITVNGLQYTWYDNPQGTVSGMKWEFVSSREYDGTTKTWGPYSTPGIWSKFGEDGRDGDGFEYIFKGFSTEPNWNDISSDDYPPNWTSLTGFLDSDYRGPIDHLWEDDAIAVDNTNNKFVYMCSRKKYTDSGEFRATWHQFSTPKLWALYVAPGTAGPAGLYTLFIFITTSDDLSNTSLGNTESSLPNNWNEIATSPSSTSEYIWSSHRTVTPGINNTTYGNWCNPYKISGTNGSNGSGTTTEVYLIIPSVETIHYKKNHAEVITWNPTTITFDIYKFSGTFFTQLTGNDLSELSLTRRVYTEDGSYIANTDGTAIIGSNDIVGNQYNDPITTVTYHSLTIIGTYVQIILKLSTTQLAIKNIPIIRDYQRMLIPMGEYDENENYEITESTIPLVYCDGNYYFLDALSNIGDNNTHIAPTDSGNTVWAEATNYKVLLTDALFANFAKLGSFVIYDKYFFSQFGYVIDSSGNAIYKDSSSNVLNYYLYFDPNDPMGETLPSSGNYKFKPMKVINAESGEEWMAGGNIYINSNGDASFRGTIKAENLYRKVAITWGGPSGINTRILRGEFNTSIGLYISTINDDLDVEDLVSEYNLSIGDYFELTNEIYNKHPEYSPGQWLDVINNSYFKVCTYNADYVNATGLSNNDGVVYLPKASDFPGKMVEVHNSNLTYSITVKDVGGTLIYHNPTLENNNNEIKFNIESTAYNANPFTGYTIASADGACFYSLGNYWVVFHTAV